MKQSLALIFIILFPILAEAQSPAINSFYRNHKRDKGTMNIGLPGWLIRFGAGVARPFVKDPEAKIALRFAKKIKKMKLLVNEEESTITTGQYLQLVSEAKSNDYEQLIMVHDGDEQVCIMANEKKDVIKGMLILVKESDSFVMLSLKTKFKMEDVNKLIEDIFQAKLLKKKEEEPKPTPKPTVPQA